MSNIQEFMSQDHRNCDELLINAEAPLAAKDWPAFTTAWNAFTRELLHHFKMEEDVLFPSFEKATGITSGPTAVMRQEHEQMRGLLQQMLKATEEQNMERAAGIIESLMLLIQQHNMKEEQMLYPMSDMHIGDSVDIVGKMKLL